MGEWLRARRTPSRILLMDPILREFPKPVNRACRRDALPLAIALGIAIALPATAGAVGLRAAPQTAGPGDVVVLWTTATEPLKEARADVFDHVVPMWSAGSATRWMTLVGVDVETRPGRYPVIVRGISRDGQRTVTRTALTVIRKVFGTRRLRVDPRFSEPPASERLRIEREAQRLSAIFSGASGERYWSGSIEAPVPSRTSSPFGLRSVFNGEPRGRHNGVDFASAAGVAVHAPAAGRVVLAEALYFTGNTVVIDHGHGLYSLLAHLERATVAEGALVTRGEVVGFVGATGRATGPHLHWSVRLQGARVDPLSLMKRTRAPTR